MNKKILLLLTMSLLTVSCNLNKHKEEAKPSIESSSRVESALDIDTSSVSSSSIESSKKEESPSIIETSSIEESSKIEESSSESSSVEESSKIEESSSESSSSEETSSTEPQPVMYYGGYYSSLLSWENGEDLKAKLHNIIHGGTYKALSFTNPNYETNTWADHTSYDYEMLDVIYSGTDCEASRTGSGWQREHCFPATLMTGSATGNASKFLGRATDFHNLWAAYSSANSARGNRNYGIPNPESESYVNRLDANQNEGYRQDETNFEPGYNDKGIVARSIFYMATMYTENEYDTVNNVTMKGLSVVEDPVSYVAGNDCKFAIGNLSTLLEWSQVQVSDLEAQHNESVYSHELSTCGYAQGNRNPYVDFPDLVAYVFGSKKDSPGRLDELIPSIVLLNRVEDKVHNVSILNAKRNYNYGETFKAAHYTVVATNNDFSYTTLDNSSCSLINHKFNAADGLSLTVTIVVNNQELKYNITLNPAGECNTKINLTKEGIDKTKVNTDYTVSYGGKNFTFNVDSTSGYTITNNNEIGGFKMGSGTKPLNKLTITTNDSYKVDSVFIQAICANTKSSYNVVIKVGTTTIYEGSISYNDNGYNSYGATLTEAVTGKISITFTGSNALGLNQLSFNIVK